MRLPDFIIAGTQKAGTTWLEHNLARHPVVFTPKRQLHFFDRNYEKGFEWYGRWFGGVSSSEICGEKTTEYFDPITVETVFSRIAKDSPQSRIFIILRNPVKRALSAVQHMVNSGLEALPGEPDEVLFTDRAREKSKGFRYIERGFYVRQLEIVYRYIPIEQVCVLIFERDIVAEPRIGWEKACAFLDIDFMPLEGLSQKINSLRLSRFAIVASRLLYSIPYAKGAIRRVDSVLGIKPWRPHFSAQAHERLHKIYANENERLFQMLGYRVTEWEE